MALLDELLSKLSIGASGPQFEQMSLPAADIQAGQEAMLGTLNEALMNSLAPRMASGPITEMIQPAPVPAPKEEPAPKPKRRPVAPVQDNSQEILDRWGIPKGQRVITNDPELAKLLQDQVTYLGSTAVPGVRIPSNTPPATAQTSQLGGTSAVRSSNFDMASVQKLMSTIRQEQDPLKREELLTDLRAKAGEIGANATAQARQIAEQAVGLPALRQQLQIRQQLDRRHPLWARYQSDSQETIAVRQQIAAAEGQVEKQVRTIISEDPKLAAFDRSVSGFLGTQERLLTGALTRADRKAEAEEAMKDQLMAETTAEQRARLRVLVPSMLDKEDEELATFLVKNRNALSKEDAAVLTAQPENLVALTMQGSTSAMKVLAAEEAQRTGRSEADVQQDLRMMTKLTKDPAAIRSVAMQVYGGMESPAFTQLNALNNMVAQGLATKEQKAQRDQLVSQLALTYQSRRTQQKLMEDVSLWPIRDEAVLNAVNQAKEKFGTADILKVARLMIDSAPSGQKAMTLDRLRSEINALGIANKSLINQPDTDMIWAQVQNEVSKGMISRSWDRVKEAHSNVIKLEEELGFFNLGGIPNGR